MKMSDVFELPVHDHELLYADNTYMHSRAAAHAVNCHDDLVKAIENLIEADNAFKTGFLHAPELWDHAWDELNRALAKAKSDNP